MEIYRLNKYYLPSNLKTKVHQPQKLGLKVHFRDLNFLFNFYTRVI